MKRLFFTTVLLIMLLSARGGELVDSLRAQLTGAIADTLRVNILNDLCWELNTLGSYDEAEQYSLEAEKLALKINYKKGLAHSLTYRGLVYSDQGDYPKALKYLLKGLKINEERDSKQAMASSLNNIAIIYAYQGDFKTSLGYCYKALKLMRQVNDREGIVSSYNNIGNMYMAQGNYTRALENFSHALKLAGEIGDKKAMAATLSNTGIIYKQQQNYASALGSYFESLKLEEETGNKAGVSGCYINIGNVCRLQKKYAEALKYYHHGLDMALGIGSLYRVQVAHEGLSAAYEELEQHDKALSHYQAYIAARDSLYNEENTKKIVQAQMNFEFEKKQEVQQLEQEKKEQLHQAELKQQTTQRNGFIAGFALVLLLAGVTFKGYKQKQKANRLLSFQNMEISTQKTIIEEKNKDITDSIRYAKRIQEAILPPDNLVKQLLPDSFILYKPKDIVSGDFYFLCPSPNLSPKGREENKGEQETPLPFGEPPNKEGKGGVLIAAVDCTGHGVPGAFMSIVGHNGLTRAVNENNLSKPADILDYLNKTVHETLRQTYEESSVRDGMDIALCSFDLQNNRVEFAGAHNPLLLIRNREVIEIPADKQPIGSFVGDTLKPFTNKETELQKGDILYLFTDGYADQFGGEKGKKFKYSKLKELLLAISEKPMDEQKQVLEETFETWKGNLEQVDDVCVIGVRV